MRLDRRMSLCIAAGRLPRTIVASSEAVGGRAPLPLYVPAPSAALLQFGTARPFRRPAVLLAQIPARRVHGARVIAAVVR
jgi:hypothetical protein